MVLLGAQIPSVKIGSVFHPFTHCFGNALPLLHLPSRIQNKRALTMASLSLLSLGKLLLFI